MNRALEAYELKGSIVAIMNPFVEDGVSPPIDYDKTYRLVDDLIENNVDGILIAGTTGQNPTVYAEEQVVLIKKVYNYINGRTKVIASAGSNSTQEAIALSRDIEDAIGPTTLLHTTGYYNKPTQTGMIKHFEAIADNVQGNIILYNVPGRTVVNIDAQTTAYLSKHPKIIGEKEASGKLEQVREKINLTRENNFSVMSGEDDLVAQIMELGGRGVISASANVAPKYFVEITKAALEGDYEKAHKLQQEINPLVKKGVFAVSNPIPLAHMFNAGMRLPLCREPGLDERLEPILSLYTKEQLGIDLSRYR